MDKIIKKIRALNYGKSTDKVTGELNRLISCLTKSEKRYFKIYTSIHSKHPKAYHALFNLIEKYPNENEQNKIKNEYIEKGYKNFNEIKLHLKKILFRALHEYHLNDSEENYYVMNLHFSEILFKKGLIHDSLRELLKSFQYFVEKNNITMTSRCCELLRQITEVQEGRSGNFKIIYNQLYLLEKKLISNHQMSLELQNISNKIFDLFWKTGFSINILQSKLFLNFIEELKKIQKNKLDKNELIQYYKIISAIYIFSGNPNKIKNYIKNLENTKDIFKKETNIHFKEYFEIIIISTYYYITTRNLNKMKNLIQEMEEIIKLKGEIKKFGGIFANFYFKYFSFKLLYLTLINDSFEISNFIKNHEKFVIALSGRPRKDLEIETYFRISIAYLFINEEKLSMHYLNKITEKKDVNNHYYFYARLILIIRHYLKNKDNTLVINDIKSLLRYVKIFIPEGYHFHEVLMLLLNNFKKNNYHRQDIQSIIENDFSYKSNNYNLSLYLPSCIYKI